MDELLPHQHLSVIYQDDSLIAIDKPPGLLVHRSPIDKRETQFAVQQLRDQIGRHVFPVHRLDRPTSGILLFAYDGSTASELGQQMMARKVQKTYFAIVRGFIIGSGLIDYALRFKPDKIADKHRGEIPPQPATTEYHSLAHYELPIASGRYATSRYTAVKLHPVTGRKHQLRRHLVHLRHPILGDTTHGDGKQNKFLKSRFGFENLALTCTRLVIKHPVSGKVIEISTTPREDMRNLLSGWRDYRVNLEI
ncbi:tRNA pseudouridine(65) synthase TruC [Salinimonas chungwhensis]|uniref:tRNA pseudouridine(65) synthase TruC n=1 Tax=Salinimonas chungwhensis TaxID=265425 RepID=UPI00037D88E3|nr:tRNA pseudouridine(65) synthase TruC [Salinimonas chungwhensis]